MNIAVQRQQERVIAIMVKAGYTKMRLAHINLTRNLDLEGNTITELANRAAMTKQAMGELVDQCEKIRIVERTADPKDRRVWIVKFTDTGLAWLGELGKAVAQVEGEMVEIVGEPAFEAMKDLLAAYNRAELPPID
ncbi:MAG: MarR family winged helix-turn-helix transcriptional regulator [Novosphingobium sp.]|nr:MarR family winged helix-turn-helix transcriptional regulator [Novosphingobium sp.]